MCVVSVSHVRDVTMSMGGSGSKQLWPCPCPGQQLCALGFACDQKSYLEATGTYLQFSAYDA